MRWSLRLVAAVSMSPLAGCLGDSNPADTSGPLVAITNPQNGATVGSNVSIDVAAVQPGELRRRLGYIPQDPFLLSGTLRSALDPLGCCSTAALAEALGRVQLFEGLDEERAAAALELVVEPGGRNFSVGERQLICLARLLLSRHRVIVLDEPTANLDAATERKLRSVVATELADATVIVVSHRSAPFLDGPRVVRIQDGVAVEQAPVEANR